MSSNINITGHTQTPKNQLFSVLTKSLQIFTKSWRKVSWINSHQNFSTLPFPSTWKLQIKKNYFAIFCQKKPNFCAKKPKIWSKLHYHFLQLIFLKVQLKCNQIQLIWLSNSSLAANEVSSNINITGHTQTPKNQLFSVLTKSLQIFTKSWRKVSWIKSHQNFSTLPFPSTWKLQKKKKYFAIFGQKKPFFCAKKPKIWSKFHYHFLQLIFLKSTTKMQSNSPDMII